MFDVYAVTNSQQSATAEFDQVRLERVWGVLQLPVTAKLDWVIKYTGPEAGDLFEPALQAFEQAAAAVLERERYHSLPAPHSFTLVMCVSPTHPLIHLSIHRQILYFVLSSDHASLP